MPSSQIANDHNLLCELRYRSVVCIDLISADNAVYSELSLPGWRNGAVRSGAIESWTLRICAIICIYVCACEEDRVV